MFDRDHELTGRRAEIFLEQGRVADAIQLAEQMVGYESMTPQASRRPRLVQARVAVITGTKSAKQQFEECLTLARKSADTGFEISVRTVDRHVSALLKKLNASSRIDMIIRLGHEPWILSSM